MQKDRTMCDGSGDNAVKRPLMVNSWLPWGARQKRTELTEGLLLSLIPGATSKADGQ